MRRAILAIALIILAGMAFAQSTPVVVVAKTNTFTWNAVTLLSDGTALPTGATMSYDLVSRPVGGTAVSVLSNTTALTVTVTYPIFWVPIDVGVRADMAISGNTLFSAIGWGSLIGLPSPFTVFPGITPTGISSLTVK